MKGGEIKNVVVNTTCETRDYSVFTKLKGNRPLSMVHVKRLEESIRKYGMLQVDIIVNEHFEVIDGQNRLQAAKNAKSVVNYKIVKGYGLREAKILNENMSKWNKSEHLASYCELGYPEYIKFAKFVDDYKGMFSFSACECLLTLRTGRRLDLVENVRTSSRYFEHGYLVIEDIDKSYEYANRILEIKPFYKGYNRIAFVRTMVTLFNNKNYIHDEFLRRLNSAGSPKLEDCGRIDQYKLLIEDIYNFRRGNNKVNLRF